MRKKPLYVYRNNYVEGLIFENMNSETDISISYTVSLKHLNLLSEDDLSKWEGRYNENEYPYALDALYELTCKEEQEFQRKLMRALRTMQKMDDNI